MLEVLMLLGLFIFAQILARTGVLPANSAEVLNQLIIYLSLPALILSTIPALSFRDLLWPAMLVPWLILALLIVLVLFLGKLLGLGRRECALLVLLGSFGNTSFVGIPMISVFVGSQGIPIAIFYDQLGSFIALSTVGMVLVAILSEQAVKGADIAKRLVKFPPFWALLLALLLPEKIDGQVGHLLDRLAALLLPLALISVGAQFRLQMSRLHLPMVSLSLLLKLLISPLLALVLCLVFQWQGILAKTLVLEAAMGPMISAGILAMTSKINKELVVAILGWGLILSFVTVTLWAQLLNHIL